MRSPVDTGALDGAAESARAEPPAEQPGLQMICPACNHLFAADTFVCTSCGSGLLEIPDAPLLSGSSLDERYDVEGVIGTGGMGTVYRARQRGMEREVAIKVLHAHYAHDPRAVKRFFREAQAASSLVHPNVVTVYDFGRSAQGQLYMVMELLEGWTLGDMIHYRAPLKPGLAISIAVQICDALEEAHRGRLVHRDLKPDNVLLTTVEEGLWAKVLDFGIARAMRDPDAGLAVAESTVEIAGTPSYMSPEQILGKEPDPRSDLYALGVILYEMLTRQRPFDDESSVALCMKQLNEVPPKVSELAPGARGLDAIVAALLEKGVADRPQHARDVRAALLACPEAREAVDATELDPRLPRALGQRTTRADAALLMAQPTLDASALRGGQSPDLGEVLARAGGLELPGREPRPSLGRRGADAANDAPGGAGGKKVAIGAVAQLLVEHPSVLRAGLVLAWLQRRERRDHWHIAAEAQRVTIRVPGADPLEAAQSLLNALVELQGHALRENIALRAGAAAVRTPEELATALDLARRIAAGSPHGVVGLPMALGSALDCEVHPQTGVFLPNAGQVEVGVVRPAGSRAGGVDGSTLLWGRGLALRRLGQLADEATRSGPVTGTVVGARGLGRSALLRTFTSGRRHIFLRVSPGAAMWPGHTAARLVAACLGAPSLTGRPEELEAITAGLGGQGRELLELLLLDRGRDEPPAARALAKLIVDAVDRFADGGPVVIALDDAHLIDRASQELLEMALELGAGRSWLVVATSRWLKPGMFLAASPHRIDLRPLSLRASNAMLEAMNVGPRQRHALMAASHGQPLALELLALRDLSGQPMPSGDVVQSLLPDHLRGLEPADADRAWVAAVLGEPGAEDLAVQAARLYLEAGLTEELARWLEERLRFIGPVAEAVGRRFIEGPAKDEAPRRAERCERLGLWRLAAVEYEAAAAVLEPAARQQKQLRAAHMRARAGDVRGAIASYDASLRAGGGRSRPTELLQFASVLLDIGERDRAARVLDHVGEGLAPETEPRSYAEALALRARTAVQRGDLPEAGRWLDQARIAIDRLKYRDARAARSLDALAQEIRAEIAVSQGDRETARVNLRQARDTFRDLGRSADALRCLVDLGRLELEGGLAPRAADTFRAAARLAASGGLLREVLRAEVGLGEALVQAGELDDGTQLLRRSLRRASEEDDRSSAFALAATGMAQAMLKRGLWLDALRYVERALGAARSGRVAARALVCEARAWLGQDQPRKAARALDEARVVARGSGDGLLLVEIDQLRGPLPFPEETPAPTVSLAG